MAICGNSYNCVNAGGSRPYSSCSILEKPSLLTTVWSTIYLLLAHQTWKWLLGAGTVVSYCSRQNHKKQKRQKKPKKKTANLLWTPKFGALGWGSQGFLATGRAHWSIISHAVWRFFSLPHAACSSSQNPNTGKEYNCSFARIKANDLMLCWRIRPAICHTSWFMITQLYIKRKTFKWGSLWIVPLLRVQHTSSSCPPASGCFSKITVVIS